MVDTIYNADVKIKVAVCLIVKNEDDYIEEWLLHYFNIGFDTAIVYDNGSQDRTSHILREYTEKTDCRYIYWTPNTHDPQIDAYNDCIERFGHEFDWIAFFDVDEILVPTGEKDNIKGLLVRFRDASAIGINWVMFGSNDLEEKGSLLMMEAFTRRADLDFGANANTKAIIRPRELCAPCNNPHWFPVNGRRVNLRNEPLQWCAAQEGVTEPDAIVQADWRLHHYYTRGKKKWRARLLRGQFGGLIVQDSHFVSLDRNDHEDVFALASARRVREALMSISRLPDTNSAPFGAKIAENIVIQNVFSSKLGNLMIKYMVARKLSSRLNKARLSGYVLPEWGIEHRHIDASRGERSVTLAPANREMEVNFDRVAYLASTGTVDRFMIEGHVQRMENFPSVEEARQLFIADPCVGDVFPGHVVCPIRGAEILDAIHPGYTLLPVQFYRDILRDIGKPPVFIGQIGDDAYSAALQAAFPDALFVANGGAMQDFQTVRKAEAVVVSISTFSWLAAWLSFAETIVLPSFGLFNRDRFPDHDLLPLGDPRYRFYRFPIQDAVPLAEFEVAHQALSWRRASPSELMKAG